MNELYFLGIDIGTFESKGALMDANANIVATHVCPHVLESPKPGYAEHDAEKVWWADFCEISKKILAKSGVDPNKIVSVGCSTIGPCCLPVDENLNPLRKAILYGIDVRAANEISYLEDLYGKENIFERYGTPLTTQSAGAKVLWIKNNEPEVYAKTYKFVTGSTYLVAKLTGKFAIDNYTAATWVPLYDIENNDWEKNTSLFCRRDQLAECRWTDEIVGEVHEQASAETGLAVGTKVTTGTADASAEAFSVGVVSPGDLMIMMGSSIFMIYAVEKMVKDKRLWAGPYLFPNTYSIAAGMSCAGTLTRWFRDNFAIDIAHEADRSGKNVYAMLADMIKDIPAGSEGLIVLPYFSGERTPINDPLAKGMIFGLNLHHSRSHIYNAILEGVGYGINQHLQIFAERKLPTKKIMAVGGGTKNSKWLQSIADISGEEIKTAEIEIGAAYGDALLSALAIKYYTDTNALMEMIKIKKIVHPNAQAHQIYIPAQERYNALYESTKSIMHSYS